MISEIRGGEETRGEKRREENGRVDKRREIKRGGERTK